MKITPSLPLRWPTPAWHSLSWGHRTIILLTSCTLLFVLFKKITSLFSPTPPASSPPPVSLSPPPSPPSPLLDPSEAKLTTYLSQTLLLASKKDFSLQLGTQLESFALRGITTVEDLACLGLQEFSQPLTEVQRKISAIAIDTIDGDKNRAINQTIIDQASELEELLENFCKYNNPIQEISQSNRSLAFDLSQEIQTIQKTLATLKTTCSVACVRPRLLKANKTSLETILQNISALDRKRQLGWLKCYLLQQDLLTFWNLQDDKSLSIYKATQDNLTLSDLFQLGFKVPLTGS